ncbi:hypothetical protein NSK_005949 [Nannochloropsis salina CCMP1776]|uniref:RNB domain-containing protein n=1 Tax=Nannochloropsis salina CCMP1776 TaxID=1027361 RepID=A0A4D9CV05_9STRA|nr:hypothetical protein NSK_005949 [Nannochloropsis salina CCMP1776]|eukprot:TFJ82756.1 hypothetical protein NSK_005949 [Nannochloropsis salina CCMP1776]
MGGSLPRCLTSDVRVEAAGRPPAHAATSLRSPSSSATRIFSALVREGEGEDEDKEEDWAMLEFKDMLSGGKRKAEPRAPKLPPRGPSPVQLQPESPVEIWHQGHLAFGNYEGRLKKASINVRLEHGERVAVDAGQLTGIWAAPVTSEQEQTPASWALEEQEGGPATPEAWAVVRLRAGRAMKSLSPRALSLERFWSLAMHRWRRDKAPVDSHHLAAFLFHRPEYEAALKEEQQERTRESENLDGSGKAAFTLRLPNVSPAQRYAAAVLLAAETFRFKRSVPGLLSPGSEAAGSKEGEESAPGLVVEGEGFRPMEQSVVHSREVLAFVQAWRLLHHLEVFSLGAGVEGLSSTSQQVLKALGEPATPEGAKRVLLRAGYWTERRGAGPGREENVAAETAAAQRMAAPWPEDILELAKEALAKTERRRAALAKVQRPNRPGRRGPHGRHDYRASGLGAYALDPPGSEFADDALGFDPETGEVLIHIADVQALVEGTPELEALARQRGEAIYLPDGPLHLLPPPALQAASLSDREVNECVTAAVTLGPDGSVLNARLLLSLVPPITRIRYDEANELLSASSLEDLPTYRRQAAQDLNVLLRASQARRALTKRSFSEGKRVSRVRRNTEGELEAIGFQRTPAHLMVDEFLALYSEAGRRFLKAHAVTLPLAPGSVSGGLDAARFGTGPLRRYTDVLAQQQMVSVLKGRPPLSKSEVIRRMTQVNWQSKASQKLRSASRGKVLLESFATYCAAKAKAAGQAYAVVRATATGTGTEVMLPDAGLRSYVRLPGGWKKKGKDGAGSRRLFDLEAGMEFEVHVLRVDPARGSIELEFAREEDAVGMPIQEEEE